MRLNHHTITHPPAGTGRTCEPWDAPARYEPAPGCAAPTSVPAAPGKSEEGQHCDAASPSYRSGSEAHRPLCIGYNTVTYLVGCLGHLWGLGAAAVTPWQRRSARSSLASGRQPLWLLLWPLRRYPAPRHTRTLRQHAEAAQPASGGQYRCAAWPSPFGRLRRKGRSLPGGSGGRQRPGGGEALQPKHLHRAIHVLSNARCRLQHALNGAGVLLSQESRAWCSGGWLCVGPAGSLCPKVGMLRVSDFCAMADPKA